MVIFCLAGKPPRPGTILNDLKLLLATRGIEVRLELPLDAGGLQTGAWPDGAIIVHRGLPRDILVRLAALEREGWPCCNRADRSLESQGCTAEPARGGGTAGARLAGS